MKYFKFGVLILFATILLYNARWFTEKDFIETRELSNYQYLIDIEPQKITNRIWREVSFEQLNVLDSDDVVFPVYVTDAEGAGAIVVDAGTVSLKHISSNGSILGTYGEGAGQGPGEFIAPSDVKVDRERNIWVIDRGKNSVILFGREGTYQKEIKILDLAARIAPVDSGYFYTFRVSGVDRLFALHDKLGEIRSQFGTLIEDQETVGIVLDGWIDAYEGSLIYVSSHSGVIIMYNSNGELVYARHSIEPGVLPQLDIESYKGGGVAKKIKRKPLHNRSITVSEDMIYMHVVTNQGDTMQNIFDVYDVKSGEYLYSYEIPQVYKSAVYSGNKVIGFTDSTVTSWALSE